MEGYAEGEISRQEKLAALFEVGKFNPKLTLVLIGLGLVVAVLEGVGLTFIVPIVEIVQADNPEAEADGVLAVFVTVYQLTGIPFTLGFVIGGVAIVMSIRYTMDFFYSWFRRRLRYYYQRHLQKEAFDRALRAEMNYFDTNQSDEILNTIITESSTAAGVINKIIKFFNLSLLSLVYLGIALWISPLLTILAICILGGITVVLRSIVNPGYKLGERVADANEGRHQYAQAGVIGIRDIRIYNLREEIHRRFSDSVDQYTRNRVKLKRNETAINKFYNLAVALIVFGLIYVALQFADLSFGELGLFLFLMFQLGPKVSSLNELLYSIENELPHLVRIQQFSERLSDRQEPLEGDETPPASVNSVAFEDVSFGYADGNPVLRDINFTIQQGEFIGFVGQSGAGKSTIVSLLARYYDPDQGRILADGTSIRQFAPRKWREHVAIVRQSPYIFNDTLRFNLTIGNRNASESEIARACEIAKVDEFIYDLPRGLDSILGDEGIQLSGGQRQRVALARALLKDADLLILDEATSDLDSNLERQVQRAIEDMDREYAIIAIAHRLSTVENADRIYSMESGRIVETGGHNELVEAGGNYAQLYALQSN